jgi:hypothetical protein
VVAEAAEAAEAEVAGVAGAAPAAWAVRAMDLAGAWAVPAMDLDGAVAKDGAVEEDTVTTVGDMAGAADMALMAVAGATTHGDGGVTSATHLTLIDIRGSGTAAYLPRGSCRASPEAPE